MGMAKNGTTRTNEHSAARLAMEAVQALKMMKFFIVRSCPKAANALSPVACGLSKWSKHSTRQISRAIGIKQRQMDVSKDRDTPKWMIYNGKPWKTLLKWMIWGYLYFWKHPDMTLNTNYTRQSGHTSRIHQFSILRPSRSAQPFLDTRNKMNRSMVLQISKNMQYAHHTSQYSSRVRVSIRC